MAAGKKGGGDGDGNAEGKTEKKAKAKRRRSVAAGTVAPGSYNRSNARTAQLQGLFEWLLPPAVFVLRKRCAVPAPVTDMELAHNLMRLLGALLRTVFADAPADPDAPRPRHPADPEAAVEGLFVLALVWSVGAVTDQKGRHSFEDFLRKLLAGRVGRGHPTRAGLRRAHFWKSSIVIIVSSSAFTVLMMSGVEMRPPFTGLRERSMRIFFCIASPTWIFFCIMSSFLWRLSARSIDCMKSGPRADPTLLGLRVDIMPGGWRWKSSPGLLDFCLMSTRPEPFTSVGPGRRRRSGGPRQGKASVFWAGHRGCALLTEA